ncbi:cysteine desulfurase family protein [Salisediminibacterium beveridgei]|uniref:Cysteine desulfurase n=1 Tax=Salisediminibacterium beveridgei TaxID=632773 RepID=A0A1D7QYD1_9BACI|nr:aminotransferase class V-fold PLP-dependent enzyme [Salisediminibacterium beveridgei]AOM84011.1 Cysteine desulfurase [Salisediminibacterium beveridgei]
MIYLDCAATTQMTNDAMEAWLYVQRHAFANSNSLHEPGDEAKQILTSSMSRIASLLGAEPGCCHLTSGGTEANGIALRHHWLKRKARFQTPHLITTTVEHPSVSRFFQEKEREGVAVTWLNPDQSGRITPEAVQAALTDRTLLVSVHLVQAETGIMQPVREIGQLLHNQQIAFHVDAVQAFGKIPLDVSKGDPVCDSLSVSAHKIHGPKGTGCLWMIDSEGQKLVQGTVNIAGAAALAEAISPYLEPGEIQRRLSMNRQKREAFLEQLAPFGDRLGVEGTEDEWQLPTVIGMHIAGLQGQKLLTALDRYGIAIATGSACQAGKTDGSVMMQALYPEDLDKRTRFIRISFDSDTAMADLAFAAERILEEGGFQS